MVAVLQPINQGHQIPVDRAVVLVGRSPECDVVIDCSSKISRLHCALVQVDTTYFIRDLGSMNGVFVDGERIEKERQLTHGVEVAIGDVRYTFRENVQPPAKLSRPSARISGMPVLSDDTRPTTNADPVPSTILEAPERPSDNPRPGRKSPPPPTRAVAQQTTPGSIPAAAGNVDFVDAVEIVEDVEVLEDVEVIEDVVVLDDVEVVEDVEIVEDVEVIDDLKTIPRRNPPPRQPPRR